MSIATGTRLGQYEVQDFIGQGAMGRVFRAYHSELERTGAVKVMQAMTPDPDTVARFRHEAQAIAKLRHPNIVEVYDFGEYQGTPYMIVEYIPGGSLAERMARAPLDRQTALRYLRGIAAGLDYAHGRGVVHRDVKPANVLLAADETPILADFGLAKLMQGSSLKSLTGVTTGTPAYMAPEQVTGGRVGPAADRYSLASIAYEMLTGVIPFDGEGLMEVLYAQVHRYPSPPSERVPSLGPAVDAVIMRALAKNPVDRWESCSAFIDALASALEPAQVAAATMVMGPRPPVAPRVAETLADDVPLAYPSPPPAAAAAKRRSRAPLIALAAMLVLVALVVAGVAGWAATHPAVTLSLSSASVNPGDTLVVSADHMPGNQAGHVELWSAQYTFPFRADSAGHVELTFTVPYDIAPGDHQVKICRNGACVAEQTLHVRAPLASPSPSSSPSASPRRSPTPTASPRTTATPTFSNARTLTTSSATVRVNGTLSARGTRFPGGKVVTVTFVQGSTNTNYVLGHWVVGSTGVFDMYFQVPTSAREGPAYLVACDPVACAYAPITVLAS